MYETIQFGTVTLRKDRPFLVAEAGVNHENSLDVALQMVEEAAKAGADAIKFQSYKADTLLRNIVAPAGISMPRKEARHGDHIFG
jgi:sialic acid synthase SpsE